MIGGNTARRHLIDNSSPNAYCRLIAPRGPAWKAVHARCQDLHIGSGHRDRDRGVPAVQAAEITQKQPRPRSAPRSSRVAKRSGR